MTVQQKTSLPSGKEVVARARSGFALRDNKYEVLTKAHLEKFPSLNLRSGPRHRRARRSPHHRGPSHFPTTLPYDHHPPSPVPVTDGRYSVGLCPLATVRPPMPGFCLHKPIPAELSAGPDRVLA